MKYTFHHPSGIGMRATSIGIILLIFCIYQVVSGQLFIAAFVLMLALPFFFIRKYCTINTSDKSIFSYFKVLGMPIGSKKWMYEIKGIKLLKVHTSRTVNARVQSNTIKDTEFRSYIYFDDSKLLLAIDSDRKELEKEMKKIANELGIPLKT